MGYIGSLSKNVDVECDVDLDIDMHDMETLIDHMDNSDKNELLKYLLNKLNKGKGKYTTSDTLEGDMKEEWWQEAKAKYSLAQLEEILGNKFDLM